MKKVVDAATVAHLWANQLQDEARTPGIGNFYFDGPKLYSYGRHFTVGKIVTNDKGETAVLLTTRRYSNTTNKHQGLARNATRHLKQIFVVAADEGNYANFEQWLREIKAIEPKLAKARKPETYLLEIAGIFNTAKIYADFFGYEIPADLAAYGNIDTPALIEATKKRIEAEKQAAQKQLTETLAKWKNFEFSGYFVNKSGYDYLRYNAEIDRVETSQGVKIPGDTAKQFYAYVLSVLAAGGCTDCNTKLLNMYQVTEINSKAITVGCHKIQIAEIKELTNKLGW